MSIPVIQFNQHPSPGQAIDDCLHDLGFMQISDFGIDNDLLKEVYDHSKAFFRADSSTKLSCQYRSAKENFGYQGLLEENLDPSAPADLKETFTMRNILKGEIADERWPSVEFKQVMQRFYANALEAGHILQRAIAKHLNLDEEFFSSKHNGESISLRLLYYPARSPGSVIEHQLGAGAHTDYGFLTLLFQDNVGGLQVLNQNDEWQDVVPQGNTVVVNSGDLLERWSNGHYRSTLHRVAPRINGKDRLSIAMFFDPDSPTWVEPLQSFISDEYPCRYTATTAGEHIQEKIQATHKKRFLE
ncbi:2OG-Fe(II) oxygenase family protein [uncultured Paraglaciecola sp.]|uniref:isopenicillin N synthase family dioxygenase n=1 Tax=uncultured Paraglaciecola sp. TaxID=1765024 RepID=UPI0030D73AE4|tara:strand:- start:43220 stop:44122 length:903 start_codon:yes stop_codon:yes gene_type:complete